MDIILKKDWLSLCKAQGGFELPSRDYRSHVLDHYTTQLWAELNAYLFINASFLQQSKAQHCRPRERSEKHFETIRRCCSDSGQRFALVEQKTVLAWLLRCFRVRSVHRRDQVRAKAELILRPCQGVHVRLDSRRKANASLQRTESEAD